MQGSPIQRVRKMARYHDAIRWYYNRGSRSKAISAELARVGVELSWRSIDDYVKKWPGRLPTAKSLGLREIQEAIRRPRKKSGGAAPAAATVTVRPVKTSVTSKDTGETSPEITPGESGLRIPLPPLRKVPDASATDFDFESDADVVCPARRTTAPVGYEPPVSRAGGAFGEGQVAEGRIIHCVLATGGGVGATTLATLLYDLHALAAEQVEAANVQDLAWGFTRSRGAACTSDQHDIDRFISDVAQSPPGSAGVIDVGVRQLGAFLHELAIVPDEGFPSLQFMCWFCVETFSHLELFDILDRMTPGLGPTLLVAREGTCVPRDLDHRRLRGTVVIPELTPTEHGAVTRFRPAQAYLPSPSVEAIFRMLRCWIDSVRYPNSRNDAPRSVNDVPVW